MFGQRVTSLRVRLVVAFLLVNLPAMLGSAFAAAWLLGAAFDHNIEQWLGETVQFMSLQLRDGQSDIAKVAKIFAKRVPALNSIDDLQSPAIRPELDMIFALGNNVITVYDRSRQVRYTSVPIADLNPMPVKSDQSLFEVYIKGRHYLMFGAVEPATLHGEDLFVLVGNTFDAEDIAGLRFVTSLNMRLFRRDGEHFVPYLNSSQSSLNFDELPASLIERLKREDQPIVDQSPSNGFYRAIYVAMKNSNGALVGVIFCGLETPDSFFAQVGKLNLFAGIYGLGAIVSIIAGLVLSRHITRPLLALTQGVRSVTAGDYSRTVPAGGGAEMSELALGFNKMAAQLNRMHSLEKELRRRDRLSALGEAVAVIAHEVRNPLGIIKSSTELVQKRAQLAPAEHKLLDYVIDEVRRIDALVREFLDFAHPAALIKSPVDIAHIVARVAGAAELDLKKRQVSIKAILPATPVMVYGSEDQLHQAMLNLILNAADAMPGGGVIRIELTQLDNTRVSIAVEDEGMGVADDKRVKIFEPFFTTKAKGTGLGLPKVKSIAEAHEGEVVYEDAVGGGALFRIVLPVLRTAVAA